MWTGLRRWLMGSDPLKLAEEIEASGAAQSALIAAALRLAEAGCDMDSFIDYNVRFTWCRVCDADLSSPRDLPREGHKDECAYYAYRAAREGK